MNTKINNRNKILTLTAAVLAILTAAPAVATCSSNNNGGTCGGGGSTYTWKLGVNGGTATSVASGATVNINGSTNILVTQSGTSLTFATNPNLTATSITTGGVSLSGNGLNNGGKKATGVAAGLLSASSTDAVNGSQLYQTNQSVDQLGNQVTTINNNLTQIGGQITTINNGLTQVNNHLTTTDSNVTNLDHRVTQVEGDVTTINGTLANAVMYDSASHNQVTLGGVGSSPVVLANVASGTLSSTSTDAINGSQLYATNQQVGQNTTDITNLTNSLSQINVGAGIKYFHANSVLADSQALGTDSTAAGPNAQAKGWASIAVGQNSTSTGSQDIAIGSEAQTTGNYGGVAIGGGYSAQGKYNIAGQFGSAIGYGSQAKGVGDTALGAYANTGDVNPAGATNDSANSYRTAVGYKSKATGEASVAVGAFNSATGASSVVLGYASSDGGLSQVVSVGAVGFERQIVNVAAGTRNTDAVNLGQLNGAIDGVNTSINNLTTVVNQQGTQINQVNQSVTNLSNSVDQRFTQVNSSLTNINNTVTNLGSTVNNLQTTVTQQGSSITNLTNTVGGLTSTVTNLTSQTVQNTQDIQTNTQQIAQNTVQINALVNGQAGVCTVSTSGGLACSIPGQQAASATGQGALAMGAGATASGAGNVAFGTNAHATGANSVALGAGSTADRDNSVDVGGRQITGVAAGTQATDAVNLSQVQSMVRGAGTQVLNAANAYTDQQAHAAEQRANRYAARGIAQAIAIPSIPQLTEGQKWVGAAAGSYDGQSAVGLGFGYQVTEGLNIGGGVSSSTGSNNGGESRHFAIKVQAGYVW